MTSKLKIKGFIMSKPLFWRIPVHRNGDAVVQRESHKMEDLAILVGTSWCNTSTDQWCQWWEGRITVSQAVVHILFFLTFSIHHYFLIPHIHTYPPLSSV